MEKDAGEGLERVGLAVIATAARVLCRDDSREAHPDTRRYPRQ